VRIGAYDTSKSAEENSSVFIDFCGWLIDTKTFEIRVNHTTSQGLCALRIFFAIPVIL